MARSIRRCTSWNRKDGSPPNGDRARTTAARNSTRSRGPAGASCRKKARPGSVSPRLSRSSSSFRRRDMRFERWLYVVPLRLRSLFRATLVERELDEELQYHIERQVELNVERGMAPEEARRAALLAMGGLEQHKEACRDRRNVQIVDYMIRDVRYGLRLLGRSPIFATVAVLSLALGIGANAAIFQLIDTVRLRSLPIANPRELAEIRADGVYGFGSHNDGFTSEVTYPLWEQIR